VGKIIQLDFRWLLFALLAAPVTNAHSNLLEECIQHVSPFDFLHKQNRTLHTSSPIEIAAKQGRIKLNTPLQKPADKIEYWLQKIETGHRRARSNSEALKIIQDYYIKKGVTKKSDVPESFFELQIKAARERGEKVTTLTEKQRDYLVELALKDQRESLLKWINYFLSSDSDVYPMWAKYWSFQSILKMGKYNPETGTFSSRSKGQMGLFPELNREAFALVIDWMTKTLKGHSIEDLSDPDLEKSLGTKSFSKIYGQILKYSKNKLLSSRKTVEGKWVLYRKDSDPSSLVKTLEGHQTGWCTAAEATAKEHLSGGDFHVFYSLDENDIPTIPRIAIRMENEKIAEVRGIGEEQNLDSQIAGSNILSEKLKQFGNEGDKYLKKEKDMNLLTRIDEKIQLGGELETSELRFLYEIDADIKGFGFGADPRLLSILSKRNRMLDLMKIFDCIIYGDIWTLETEIKTPFKLPKYMKGHLDFRGLIKTLIDLVLPEFVNGSVSIDNLRTIQNIVFPKYLTGTLDLRGLTEAEGLTLSPFIKGTVILGVQSGKGIHFPRKFLGSLKFWELENAEGLILPDWMAGDLDISELLSPKNLKLPRYLGGSLSISALTTAKDLILPEVILGSIDNYGITSPEGLVLPKELYGGIYFSGLLSAEGVNFPERVEESLLLPKVKTTKGLSLPRYVRMTLDLSSLESAKGLILPDYVQNNLVLDGLTTLEGLVLPKDYIRTLSIKKIDIEEFNAYQKKYGVRSDLTKIILKGYTIEDGKIYKH
jgi:hypothetical protein